MGSITLQFVTERGIGAWAIRAYEHGFPSHVDLVVPKGNVYWPQGGLFGARIGADGAKASGVQLRSDDYARFSHAQRYTVSCSDDQERGYYDLAHQQEGKPYDWRAIAAFVTPGYDWRETDSWDCSALQGYLSEQWLFRHLIADAKRRITPRDLMLVISSWASA